MESGNIFYNFTTQGGGRGVVVGNLATFTMRGGVVITSVGCAVMVYPSGTFNHEGGDVVKCD